MDGLKAAVSALESAVVSVSDTRKRVAKARSEMGTADAEAAKAVAAFRAARKRVDTLLPSIGDPEKGPSGPCAEGPPAPLDEVVL